METLIRTAQPRALRQYLCSSCIRSLGNTRPQIPAPRVGLQNSDRIQRRHKGWIAAPGDQANPIQGFYSELVKKPLSEVQPQTRTAPAPPPVDNPPKTEREATLEKARIVFGSRLAGPAERKAEIQSKSKMVAGILVPPKPTEPDNCCMSGCVNCVWDLYRDEMEEWAATSAQARAAMQAQREKSAGRSPTPSATSMDDDGGGSEANWGAGGTGDEDGLFGDIPVGIREFMRTEKKLKQRHMAEEARETPLNA